ncbi:MAG: hypothetical protein QOC81_793 [Thermoanaerobaculia bacterium]|jgi:uncharacterized repeat protein (TIGR01451 family)|nr:hypothetical protein [Thermoanaerobaculia bacterium]
MKMKTPQRAALIVVVCATLLCSLPALAQFTQQGPKLVTTPFNGLGSSVALSADGNTAVMGATAGENVGGVWIWTRSAGVWSQQSTALNGSDATGCCTGQGNSVAISADGNTVLVGAGGDDFNESGAVGAAWVWTRTAGVWSQQGPKLIGSGAAGLAYQGRSVALSADGNTAVIGGPLDNSGVGAAWVFTRSGGVWTQQGVKLAGSGGVPRSQGTSVSVSSDGNTAMIGGVSLFEAGAAWIWTRSGGVWTQQGSPLIGTGGVGSVSTGASVSLSSDGNTAAVGGYTDNNSAGAVWIWTRSGEIWTQQGTKLVSPESTSAQQGRGLAISADGNLLIVGGPNDLAQTGGIWFWTRSAGVWSQRGSKIVGSGATGHSFQGISVSLSTDGDTALVGGPFDNNGHGAAWVFVAAADLTIAKSHAIQFKQGDTGDAYTIIVSNPGFKPTSGTVTVTDTVPVGLTPTAPTGSFDGWTCSINGQVLTCTQNDVLAPGGSYAPITLSVNVANDAPPSVINTATVSGGGELNTANDSASDPTPIHAEFVPVTPAGVIATALSSTQINVAWTAVNGSASYEIDRKAAGGGFVQIGTATTNNLSDTTPSANSSYLYRVRAVNEAGVSSNSARDLATTVIFVDNPLIPHSLVKAVHLSQLRTAVNAVRLLGGLTAAAFTDTGAAGTTIRALHVTELRSRLDEARGPLGFTTGGYTDGTPENTAIKAVHFQELRNLVQ